MTKKKKKAAPSGKFQPGDFVKKAEESLGHKRYDEAINWLLRAESTVPRSSSSTGGKVNSPAGADEMQLWINVLLADAFFNRALTRADSPKRISDLEESVKRDSSDGRYRLALGVAQLFAGETGKAVAHLRQAHDLLPGNRIAARAWALGLVASGNTREVNDWFARQPREEVDADLTRLRAISELTNGNSEAGGMLLGCASHTQAQSHVLSNPSSNPPTSLLLSQSNDASSRSVAAVRAVREMETQASPYDQLACGLLSLAAGDGEQAMKRLAELSLRHDPSRAEAAAFATRLFYRGALHFQAEHFAEAGADFAEARRLAAARELNLPWLNQLVPYCHRAAEELFTTNVSKSIDCWELVLEIDLRDKQARANLDVARRIEANRAWRDGLYERAADLWQESLRHHPQDEALLKNAALGCEKTGRTNEAVAHWRKLIQLWRPQLKSRADDGQFRKQLLQAQKHLIQLMLQTRTPVQEIQKEINAALKIDSENGELRRLSVEIYLGVGRPQQALKQIESLEAIQGETVELLLLKGVTFGMLKRLKAARQVFERAYALEPANAAARTAYLLVLGQESSEAHEDGQLELAADLCEQQLAIDPHHRPALAHLACLSFHLGKPDQARDAIARIIELDPTKAENHIEAGALYLDHGKTREAEAEFKKALDMNPDAEGFRRIGESYLDARKTKKALQYFDRAAETGSFVTLIEIAETLHEAGRDRDAEKYADLAMVKDPWHPIPHLIKALLLVEREEIEKVLEELAAVERLGADKGEYRELVEQARQMRKMVQEMNDFEWMLKSVESPSGVGPLPPELLRMLRRLG
ncbi:MAG: tetratricopeptide repeat protein [Pyrinomonadaceae bacterium]|nr:tetratricopeptide repeat protein [Pyrinomonadaceae bacterium]